MLSSKLLIEAIVSVFVLSVGEGMTVPYLSVIIPTHSRAPLLSRAVKSINAQHSRSIIEVIVVSDVVDIDTDRVCQHLLAATDSYVRRGGKPGPSASRNIGLKLAQGRDVMFLDDDDSWSSGFISSLVTYLNYDCFEAVYFNCNIIKETRPKSGPEKISEFFLDLSDRLNEEVFVKNQVHMSCFMFSRALVNELTFDCTMRAYEDWDFLLSVFERKMPVHIPITCSNVFEVDDNTTDRRGASDDATNFNAIIDYLYVYRRHAAPSQQVLEKRKNLFELVNLPLPEFVL